MNSNIDVNFFLKEKRECVVSCAYYLIDMCACVRCEKKLSWCRELEWRSVIRRLNIVLIFPLQVCYAS